MRFYHRKRRQAPAVIIVALIDILIVLLIFLLVTSTFKQQPPPALKLALPESAHAQKPGAQESPPLIVSIDPVGNLRLGPEAKPVTTDALKAALLTAAATTPDLKVAISADTKAPWGQVVKVMDLTKEAGAKVINAFIKEPGKQ